MSRRLADNKDAAKALVGRTIVSVDLSQVEEENGDASSGVDPKIVLDNGVVLRFDVDDYGSGTYGINFEVDEPKSKKGRAR